MSHTPVTVPSPSTEDQRRSRVLDATTGPVRSKWEHDMRSFLYLITCFNQLMRDGLVGPVSARQKEFLSNALDCASRAQELMAPPISGVPVEHRASGSNSRYLERSIHAL